jgi:flagellar basal body rod protein FlgB
MNGNDLTIEATRLALGMQQLRAETAARNIAQANMPGAQATRLDFSASQSLLTQATRQDADDDSALGTMLAAAADHMPHATVLDVPGAAIQLDDEVADAAAANLGYQALGEALSRHFGLMRLAITGKN